MDIPGDIEGKTREKTREKIREKIIRIIKDDPEISTDELANSINITRKGIEWQIRKMKEEGLIMRIGPDKGGYWKVL